MSHVDADVALELASHEGLVRQTYLDSVGIRTWSIGVTNASGSNLDRYVGKPQPLAHCLAVCIWLLEQNACLRPEPSVSRSVIGVAVCKTGPASFSRAGLFA